MTRLMVAGRASPDKDDPPGGQWVILGLQLQLSPVVLDQQLASLTLVALEGAASQPVLAPELAKLTLQQKKSVKS